MILEGAGQDMTAEEFTDEMWAQAQAIFGPGAEGLWEIQGAMSMMAALVAPGAFPNPFFAGSDGPPPPESRGPAQPAPEGEVEGEATGPLPATGGGFALLGLATVLIGTAKRRRH